MTADPTTAGGYAMVAPGPAERTVAYRWLAALLAREPAAETIATYRGPDGQMLLAALRELPAIAPPVDELRRLIEAQGDDLALARDLAGAFAHVFHGVGGRRSAPPCASFYRHASGRVMQAEAGDMTAELDAIGLGIAAHMHEPPDHVAVQLAVMAHLVETAGTGTQKRFLTRHLAPWIGAFSDRCASAPQAGLYAVIARAAADFAVADLERLGKELAASAPPLVHSVHA